MQYLVNPFSKLPQPCTDVVVHEGGCSHWSLHTVNRQHVNRGRFALRNFSISPDQSRQIVMWQGICVPRRLTRKPEAGRSVEHFVLHCRRIAGVGWNPFGELRWKKEWNGNDPVENTLRTNLGL